MLGHHATHIHTHTHPRGVSACYSDNAADKTNKRQIYKNGLKFHLILGDFHISAALINPVFRHACRFRKTMGARKINRLNYNRKFWSHSSPNSMGTFVRGLKIDETTESSKSLKMSSSVLTQAVVFHLSLIFLLFAWLFPTFYQLFKLLLIFNVLECLGFLGFWTTCPETQNKNNLSSRNMGRNLKIKKRKLKRIAEEIEISRKRRKIF